LQTALLDAVSAEPGGPWRAAALGELYAETDGVITASSLFLNDDGEYMDSPPDWETGLHNWAPEPWIEALTAEAFSGTVSHWEDIFTGYQMCSRGSASQPVLASASSSSTSTMIATRRCWPAA